MTEEEIKAYGALGYWYQANQEACASRLPLYDECIEAFWAYRHISDNPLPPTFDEYGGKY